MTRTKQEQDEFDRRCYGALRTDVEANWREAIEWNGGNVDRALASALSDAQAVLEITGAEGIEEARMIMNRVKMVLFEREKFEEQPDETYQGWTNYQTWNVHLYLANDQGLYNEARHFASTPHTFAANVRHLLPVTADKVRTGDPAINWDEIIEAFKEE